MLYCYADFFVTRCLAQITLLVEGIRSERRMQDEGCQPRIIELTNNAVW